MNKQVLNLHYKQHPDSYNETITYKLYEYYVHFYKPLWIDINGTKTLINRLILNDL